MDLFLDQKLTFEKLGMEVSLSEDPNDWPQQILDELYQQAPYTSDYTPKVVLRHVDADRRYGLGQVELLNKMAINQRDDDTPPKLKGTQKVVIPVIIEDGKLKPLDVLLHDGKVEPLTDERLKKALFRPNLFEAIRERPGDMSLIEQLYPPHRQYGGARGPMMGDVGASGSTKEGSAHPEFLMDAILPTIKEAEVIALADRMQEDESLRVALVTNPATRAFIDKLGSVNYGEPRKGEYLRKIAHAIKPDVIQIQKIDGGFRVKKANSQALIPDSEDIARPAAVGALGGDLVSRVETDGTATITTQPAVKQTLTDLHIEVVDQFGLYKVKVEGEPRELVGWVFPKVMEFDGTLMPMALFANGSEFAMQENIAGVPLGKSPDLIDQDPIGSGCFYYASPEGAIAFSPIEILSTEETPEGSAYHCLTTVGERVLVSKVPGLKMVSEMGEGHYGIPEDCGWIGFSDKMISLASTPDEFTKVGEARALTNAVRVITDGVTYTFQGQPVEKLAGVMETEFLNRDDAVFLGAILGAHPAQFQDDLTNMRKQGSQEVWFPAREVRTYRERYTTAKTAAAAFLSKMPDLKTDLVKEATPIEDPTAVDKILSVGFINPENVSIFASYLPEFEATVRKLAELLVAARMGLHTIDEGALQKSLTHLDKVIAGLKTLSTLQA